MNIIFGIFAIICLIIAINSAVGFRKNYGYTPNSFSIKKDMEYMRNRFDIDLTNEDTARRTMYDKIRRP